MLVGSGVFLNEMNVIDMHSLPKRVLQLRICSCHPTYPEAPRYMTINQGILVSRCTQGQLLEARRRQPLTRRPSILHMIVHHLGRSLAH